MLPKQGRQEEENDSCFEIVSNFRNVFGTSSFWKLVPIPAAVGGLTIYFATERVEGFFSHATAMIVCISNHLNIKHITTISLKKSNIAGFRNADP